MKTYYALVRFAAQRADFMENFDDLLSALSSEIYDGNSLSQATLVVRGWGGAMYSYCGYEQIMSFLDNRADELSKLSKWLANNNDIPF